MSDLDIYNNESSNDLLMNQFENDYDYNLYSEMNDDTICTYEVPTY